MIALLIIGTILFTIGVIHMESGEYEKTRIILIIVGMIFLFAYFSYEGYECGYKKGQIDAVRHNVKFRINNLDSNDINNWHEQNN